MSIIINQKYLKKVEPDIFHVAKSCKCTILPPEKAKELEGYVMYYYCNNPINFKDELEINPNEKQIYMFEKEEKIKNKKSPRYRYTEKELYYLYQSSSYQNFDKIIENRKFKSKTGRGRLVYAEYSDYEEYNQTYINGHDWLIITEHEDKWAYPLNYDPMDDKDKHKIDSNHFKIMIDWKINDISIFLEQLKKCEKNLYEYTDMLYEYDVDPDYKKGFLVLFEWEDMFYTFLQRLPSYKSERKELDWFYYVNKDDKEFIEQQLNNTYNTINRYIFEKRKLFRTEQIKHNLKVLKEILGNNVAISETEIPERNEIKQISVFENIFKRNLYFDSKEDKMQ